jgi:non-ribosomal peptide synthase protein (TIGR01720 family)
VQNTQVYVVDEEMVPVAVGVVGEIMVGGEGVGRGYLRDAGQTAKRYVPDGLGGGYGVRLYRTGDVGRHWRDGRIEYLGRRDEQVKVHGYRIELGEVETVLREHSGVREVVVTVREDVPGNKHLVAYVVGEGEVAEASAAELRNHLKARLPEYMVPTAIVQLDEMPLTANGKVDRRALPAPEHTRSETEEYVPPRTAAEQTLARIWSEVLRVNEVSIYDNFFELGGDSILSIQVISRANRAGLKLTPRQLFEQPTVAALAEVAGTAQEVEAEQGVVTGAVELTPVQHWFFEQQMVDAHHFNQAVMLAMPSGLELSLLEESVNHLVVHHDALRLRFHLRAGAWQQSDAEVEENQVFEAREIHWATVEERAQAIHEAATQVHRSLELEQGPLLRVAYFDLGKEQLGRVLIVVHHLAMDGMSWQILLEDLRTIYEQLSRHEEVELPAKTTSYQQWAKRLVAYAASEELQQEISYWTDPRRQQVRPLPVDMAGADNTRQSTAVVVVELDAEQTRALVQEVPQVYHTQINDLLLTALAQAFRKWSGQERLLIDLEGHGREDIFAEVDVSRTVGWFTTIFPVPLEVSAPENGDNPQAAVLKAVKEQLREVPRRGLGYGLLRYLSTDVSAGERLKAQPQAEVSFNYLGQVDQVLGESSLFAMAGESSGAGQSERGQRDYLLEINAIIAGGQLRLSWSYSQNLHHRETIEAVAAEYIQQLQQLIAHCQSSEAGGYTPSDFPDVDLSQGDLDELLTELQ